ncbi:MAG: tRNA (adenosine(37)-N6)-dimethylallyltransferase MiaA, partial [Alphaproteobacteria bacterium]|nr:tRNA (adenosine(37)-N6)-dimethylallyltransferase MiaA [Alphaproteobacteria bacterium]
MAEGSPKRALLIAGPTASGKSALALRRARERERHGVIINADALQVYGELRILSARPGADEEAQVPHRLYGHVSGRESYSVARWLADARVAISAAWRQGKVPIVTGGTGLYFKALDEGLAEVPEISADVRAHWRSYEGDLHGELRRIDPAIAARLSPNDRQRLTRALEVATGTGKSLLVWQEEVRSSAILAGAEVERMFLDVPRADLYGRAEARFDKMVAAGALDEVAALEGYDLRLPVMKAIGVPELTAHVRG